MKKVLLEPHPSLAKQTGISKLIFKAKGLYKSETDQIGKANIYVKKYVTDRRTASK